MLIGRGRTADVYSWGKDRVLKLYQAWMPAPVVEREFNVTRAAAATGIPVPAAYELVETEGRHGIVFERIAGVSLLAELQAKPWRLFAIARQLGELHAQIHACKAPGGILTQLQEIERGIETARDVTEADKQAIRSHLAKLPGGESFCHGDFHPDNILLSTRGPVVIDWLTGTRGQSLADVARTSLLFQTAGLPAGTPLQVRTLINISRNILHSIYLKRYLQLRPAARFQIDQWQLPLIAARLCEVEEYPQEKQLLLTRLRTILNKQLK